MLALDFFHRHGAVFQAPDPAAPSGTPTPPDPARGTPTPQDLAPAPAAPEPAPAPRPDPVQQRMDTLTAQRWAEKRRADEAEARARLAEETLNELRRLQEPEEPARPSAPAPRPPAAAPGTISLTPEQLQQRVTQEAAAQDYNRRVNDTVAEGRKLHKDFDESIGKFKTLTGDTVPPQFVAAVLETGRGADVLYALGNDLAEADRILQLSPARQVVELTRFADKLAASQAGDEDIAPASAVPRTAPAVSRVTPPIASRAGGGGGSVRELDVNMPAAADPDKGLSTEEWVRRRNEDIAKKRASGARGMR